MFKYNLTNYQEHILCTLIAQAKRPNTSLAIPYSHIAQKYNEAEFLSAISTIHDCGFIKRTEGVDTLFVIVYAQSFTYKQDKIQQQKQARKDYLHALFFEYQKAIVIKLANLTWWGFGVICGVIIDRFLQN